MKKYMVEQQSIIFMYEYFVHYCQLEEQIAFQYCNYSHERIQNVLRDKKIGRFPIACYQDEYAKLGIVLWVADRRGKTLPYINPMLLGKIEKEEIIRRLVVGKDSKSMLEELLLRTQISIVSTSFVPEFSGYTRKKSYQKKIDQKRKGWLE